MDHNSNEMISAAYTIYSLLSPAGKVIISIESFAEAFNANLSALDNAQGTFSENSIKTSKRRQMTEAKAEEVLKGGYADAEKTLDDSEKLTSLLEKLKQKMKSLPMVGNVLANVPTMFRLLNSYLKGEYTDIPRKDLVITVSAITYLVSPIDLIPDLIPIVGLLDDIAIISLCINLTQTELKKYLTWREQNGMSNTETID